MNMLISGDCSIHWCEERCTSVADDYGEDYSMPFREYYDVCEIDDGDYDEN